MHSHILCLKVSFYALQESTKIAASNGKVSSLEHVLALVIPHIGQKLCTCPNIDPQWSFSSQILTIPFLWKFFPYLKEVAIFLIALLWGLNSYCF